MATLRAAAWLGFLFAVPPAAAAPPTVLVENGVARLPVLAGSVPEPAAEIRQTLARITGADVKLMPAREGVPGIHVGLAADFPWVKFDRIDELGREGFVIRGDGTGVFLVAREPAGVRHAAATFLHSLGCRWYFPGKTWEVIPEQKTVAGSWDVRQTPSFPLQRKIWYGFGGEPTPARDLLEWERHNRLGGAVPITIGHTWHGLDPDADFKAHPEWFALVGGVRKPSKPCYSHPDVVQRGVRHALETAARGDAMISMTPPDGLGYCECERCLSVCRGAKPYVEQGAMFAKRPDGVLVNVTSETLFGYINQIAAAVAEKYPKTLVGCYAYSAYSHPPSFAVRPNVFLQTTTAFRRTPLTLAEQLDAFRTVGVTSGIRGYFSVYQWDWDYPAVAAGDLSLPRLVDDLRFYHKANVQSVNGESCCNWGPRGLGYYLAARLMWDVADDPKAIIADFYDKAFGPAALPMERYYVRWLGPYAAVRTRPAAGPAKPGDAPAVADELGIDRRAGERFGRDALAAAYHDLDEAARLTTDRPDCRARVDHLRLYAHYLYLRVRLDEAARGGNKAAVAAAVRDEAVFGARLTDTGMIHARPLVGKEFYRRFLAYKDALEGTPEWPRSDAAAVRAAAGVGYRKVRSDVPGADELARLWADDKRALGVP